MYNYNTTGLNIAYKEDLKVILFSTNDNTEKSLLT